MITVHAPAKLNLVLEVLGKQGRYHDICSIAQTIDLCDTITVAPAADLSFTCSQSGLVEDNIVVRAAQLLRQEAGVSLGAHIHLDKRIPWAAGLGGGSSDAAATLTALRRLWRLDMPDDVLAAVAARLGSDVPLFLVGGTVLLTGRGDRVRRLPAHPASQLILLLPQSPAPPGKTGLMYARLQPEMFTTGQFGRAAAFALERGGRISELLLYNTFEKVAKDAFPDILRSRQALEAATGKPAHLTGSGPCLFSLVAEPEAAESALRRLQLSGLDAIAAAFMPPTAETIR